jgi:hypothetical protein
MLHRFAPLALVLGLVAAGCSDSTTNPSDLKPPTFTSTLLPSNEVPPITNADSTGRGTVTVTLNTQKDGSGNITSATADFQVTLTGFPANTTLTGAHIHQAAAGTNAGVLVNTGLPNGEVVLTTGSGNFARLQIVVDPAVAQGIINNPSGYYFNVHTTLNTGGAARGQLAKAS